MINNIYLAIIIIILSITSMHAQSTGSIGGRIVERTTKKPLIGANISVIDNNNTVTTFGSTSDEQGTFLIKNVPENIYKLKISYIGYGTHLEPDILVVRGKTFEVNEIELTESPLQSGDVTITTGNFIDDKQMPVSSYSYTRQEIVRAPGAMGDVFRAIETLPGVSTSGGEFSAFSVRGDTPQDNIILIDNISFSAVSHFTETGGNLEVQGGRLSIFPQGMISKAEFQSGGFSSKFGGKRASLLNLSIKEGNKLSPTFYGAYDLTGFELNYDGPAYAIPNSGILFSARKVDFGTILKMIDEESDGSSSFADYVIKTSTDINSKNKLNLLGIYSAENHQRDPYHYFKGKNFDQVELSKQTENKNLFGLNWTMLTGINGFLNTSIYYSKLTQHQASGQISTDPVYSRMPLENEINIRNPIYVFDIKESQIGVKSDYTYSPEKFLAINTGVQVQRMSADNNSFLNGADTLFIYKSGESLNGNKYVIVSPDNFNNDFNKSRMEYAGYAEVSFSQLENIDLGAGIRIEYDNWSNKLYPSPRLNGSFKINNESAINFAAGIYYQLPRTLDVSYNNKNVNLLSERSIHFILGTTRYLAEDLKLNIESYYKKLDNLIVQPLSNSEIMKNAGRGYSYGVDLSLIKRFVKNIYGQVNYSYSQCKVKNADNLSYHYSDFNQPHMFNILAGYQMNINWSFSVKWKYATGRPKDSFVIHANVLDNLNEMRFSKEIMSVNSGRYTDFHSLNLRVDYRNQFSDLVALDIFLDIMNLYGRSNQVYDTFEPVSGKDNYSSFGFMPTLGLKIEI